MDCSPPGSSVHGILQARILEWVAIPFSRGSSWPRDQTQVCCIAGGFFTVWATRETKSIKSVSNSHLNSNWRVSFTGKWTSSWGNSAASQQCPQPWGHEALGLGVGSTHLQPPGKSQIPTVTKTAFLPLGKWDLTMQLILYGELNETKQHSLGYGRCPINDGIRPLPHYVLIDGIFFCWDRLIHPLPHSLSYSPGPSPTLWFLLLPKPTSPRILSSNCQSAPTQATAYGPSQSPHDLIQLDCYFYRLVLRSISQECYIHCHAEYSQACGADGAFLEFYGTTHGPLASISDPTLSGDQRKSLEGSLPTAALSPPCLPSNCSPPKSRQHEQPSLRETAREREEVARGNRELCRGPLHPTKDEFMSWTTHKLRSWAPCPDNTPVPLHAGTLSIARRGFGRAILPNTTTSL